MRVTRPFAGHFTHIIYHRKIMTMRQEEKNNTRPPVLRAGAIGATRQRKCPCQRERPVVWLLGRRPFSPHGVAVGGGVLLEVILAMGVIMIAMAVIASGFILSTIALGLALAVIAMIFLAATGIIALGILVALALGFLGTLISPLIPILPIILFAMLGILIYIMGRLVMALVGAGMPVGMTLPSALPEILANITPQ